MFYDEDAQRRRDRLSQVLSVPVTDFELSVRSRNCLQKMGVMTLGDLARTTEAELLASKNFGETSLVEIREMMASKGLQLGQMASEQREPEPLFEPESMSPDEQALFGTADLRSEFVGPCPQVHGPAWHQHDLRIGSPHGRRSVGVQEFRRDQLERSPREADGPEPQAPRRLMVNASLQTREGRRRVARIGEINVGHPGLRLMHF